MTVEEAPHNTHEQVPLPVEILTKTLDNLPIGVGIFRVDDVHDSKSIHYVFMNKVVLYEMRKNKEDVYGKRILDVAPEAFEHEGGRMVMEAYRKVAENGKTINLGLVEYSNHMVAGTYECSVHHIVDNYVYVMLRNVTELEQTKNQLEASNHELRQFAHMASHDLKAPLNTITAFLDFLSEGYSDKLDEDAQSLMSQIGDTTTRMRNLINTLLHFSTIGQDQETTEVDCNELIADVQADLAATIKERGAKIEVGHLPTLKGYATELRLLMQNLICNSIKYTDPDSTPHLKIDARQEGKSWLFSFSDNGIGISEKDQDKIFSIFERIRANKHIEGSGIGLAHCKKIVEMHQGSIWAESEPGKGSTFYFTVPQKD